MIFLNELFYLRCICIYNNVTIITYLLYYNVANISF